MAFVAEVSFGDYEGGGTFDVTVDVDQMSDVMASGGVFTQSDPLMAGGNVMVTYTTAETIPEPSTFALLGLGAALGLAAIRRHVAS